MLLTDAELRDLQDLLDEQAGLDPELAQRCGHLIRVGAFDEAVRSAFVLLEERLRKAGGIEGMTGVQLAGRVLHKNSEIAKLLAHTENEREGLRELFAGAFRLFRNPTAHGVVGYTPAEGKAIIGLVDLLLGILGRVEIARLTAAFPENLEQALGRVEGTIGAGATSRLRAFLAKCVNLGIEPVSTKAKWDIPFRRTALYLQDNWDEPRPHGVRLFYLNTGSRYGLTFPFSYYYVHLVDFDAQGLMDELLKIGFVLHGKDQDPFLDFRRINDQASLDKVLDLLAQVADDLDAALHQARSEELA